MTSYPTLENQNHALFFKITEFADIPIPIMMWLIDKAQLSGSLLDIPILQPGDIDVACTLFIQQFQMDIEHCNMWTPVISNQLNTSSYGFSHMGIHLVNTQMQMHYVQKLYVLSLRILQKV